MPYLRKAFTLRNMKKIILALAVLGLLAAGCQSVKLKQEVPTSPKESYEPLPQ